MLRIHDIYNIIKVYNGTEKMSTRRILYRKYDTDNTDWNISISINILVLCL